MNTLKSIGWPVLLLSATLTGVRAQPFRTNTNPALLYYQAFLVAPAPLPQSEWDYLRSNEGRSKNLPDRYGEILAGYDSQFALVRQAARATAPCDWGVDLSAGMESVLPYLAPSKQVAVMDRLRMTWDLQHNRQADALRDWLASMTLARNASRGGLLISTLVQFALEAICCNNVAERFGEFAPDTLQQLATGLDRLPPQGTLAGAVPVEQAFFEAWMLEAIEELRKEHPGDDASVMAGMHGKLARLFELRERAGLGSSGNSEAVQWWENLSQAAGGTSDGLISLVRDLEPVGQELAAVLALPCGEYRARMKQLKVEVEQSNNPLIPLLIFPAWENGRMKEFRVRVLLAMVRAAVEYKLHGEPGLQSVADPCGPGPFVFRRFCLQGVDRGFELRSANDLESFPQVLIFVEKQGPAFYTSGPYAGQTIRE